MNNQIELPFIKNRKAYSPKGVINLMKEAERDNNGKLNEIFRNKHNYKQLVEMWHASFLVLSIYKWLGKKFFLFPSDAPDIYFLEEDTNNAFQLEIMELYNFNNKEFDNDYKKLVLKFGEKCQLRIHPNCSKEKVFDVDHFIPLSTNKLNKEIRNVKAEKGKKVVSQSFGSNDISNLKIACRKCNNYKKHQFLFD